jgi:hypothetical protein
MLALSVKSQQQQNSNTTLLTETTVSGNIFDKKIRARFRDVFVILVLLKNTTRTTPLQKPSTSKSQHLRKALGF